MPGSACCARCGGGSIQQALEAAQPSMSGHDPNGRLVRLTFELPREEPANLPDAVSAGASDLSPAPHDLAKRLIQFRRKRENVLPRSLFGEPAWDMLLDLYVHQTLGRDVGITSLCLASGVPQTTALRYIGQMEKLGMIERLGSATDLRVCHLIIEQETFTRIGSLLAADARLW